MTGCRAMESSREYERLRQRRYRAAASEEAKNTRRTADADRKRRRLQEEPDDKTYGLVCISTASQTLS